MSENKKQMVKLMMTIFSSDSECESTDSEDTDEEVMKILELENNELQNFKKNKGKRNCVKNYMEKQVPTYTEEDFTTHFRVTKNLFQSLCEKFENSSEFQSLRSDRESAEKHVAVFLWFAGHTACSFRDLADRFSLSLYTVGVIIERMICFLSNLAPEVITWPTEARKKEISDYFVKKTGFPNVIGAIDVTHIVIDPPTEKKDDYIDRKGNISIVLQGICDEKRNFISVFVGFPGSYHDNWVLHNSFIYPKLRTYCGEYYILGDSAYPCMNFLLTPYRDNGHLTRAQINYNKKLSSCRVTIEHAFEILKQRFRQLYYCKLRGIRKLCHFVRACCVLHNLCLENDSDFLSNEIINRDGTDADENEDVRIINNVANAIRERICSQLSN